MRRPGRLTRAGGLVAVLVTALSLAPAATAGQDSTAPVLTAVTLDVGALHPGDVVPVHIAASDDGGGPVSGLVVWARSDGGDLITRTSAPTTVTAATWDGVFTSSSTAAPARAHCGPASRSARAGTPTSEPGGVAHLIRGLPCRGGYRPVGSAHGTRPADPARPLVR